MNRRPRIVPSILSFLNVLAFWLAFAVPGLAADPATKPAEGGFSDYMLSYMVVVLGIVLGMLVVAKPANRRDRQRPAGYVEKNIVPEKH